MADAELSLINKVELRLVVAKTDDRLSELLKVYLPPLLLKLNSPHASVRAKIVEVCQHINQRVRSSSIAFPVEALFTQFKNSEISADARMMRTFDLMYIQKGLDSLSAEEKNALIPKVLGGISSADPSHAPTLFKILLHLLKSWKPFDRGTTEADNIRVVYGFESNPDDAKFVASKFQDLFNLDLSIFRAADNSSADNFQSPGLNSDQIKFLTGNSLESFPGSDLFDAKLLGVRFLLNGGFTDSELYLPLLIASHDSRTEVINAAEGVFKKLKVDLEDPELVSVLYDMALGTSSPQVKPVIVSHVIQILSKSRLAANFKPRELIAVGFASEYRKTTQSVIQFIRWVSRETSDEKLQEFAADLINELIQWINSNGWPRMATRDTNLAALRSSSYEAIGSILKRSPQLMADLEYIKFLLDSLEMESIDIKPSVQEALSEALPGLNALSDESTNLLCRMLLKYFLSPAGDQGCRYIAVRYAVRATRYSNAIARLICIMGMSTENRADVIEEAKRGLHPYWFKLLNSQVGESMETNIDFPDFASLLAEINSLKDNLPSGPGSQTLHGIPYHVYSIAMTYLEQIIIMDSVKNKKTVIAVDDQWELNIENAIEIDENVRNLVKAHLNNALCNSESYTKFFNFLFDGMAENNNELSLVGRIYLRMLSLSPQAFVESQGTRVRSLISLLKSSKYSVVQVVANCLGIIATDVNSPTSEILKELTNDDDTDPRYLLASAYIIARLNLRGRLHDTPSDIREAVFGKVTAYFNKSNNLLDTDLGLESITQLSLFGVSSKQFLQNVRDKVLSLLKKDSENAFFAWGAMAACDKEARQDYINEIYANTNGKYPNLMLSSGEALVLSCSGWASELPKKYFDIASGTTAFLPAFEDDVLVKAISEVLVQCKNPKPILRKYSCTWMLSIVQYCGKLAAIQPFLEEMHLAFMRFLADRDDNTQELASRGLSIIYELGNSDLKERLVKGLVKSFTSESTYGLTSGSVDQDTQLFEPGVLNTGDGSISTYKDILSLASEVGDPSLVYKFMSLAGSSSLWASKRGAAFGLGSLMDKANFDQLFQTNEKLSSHIIPKLYRYRFDPNSSVQATMRGIWDTLLKDKTKAIDKYFFDILRELLKSMGDKEWRVRQASTAALGELLQTKRIADYQDYLEHIWKMSFRVLDDVKDSVRTAGLQLTRGLTTSLVRQVEVESGNSEKVAEKILSDLIPFLMGTSGLQSDSEDVQKFALNTLLKLCKKGGKALRAYIPDLVTEMLDLLSTLEPQAMNYLALNADKYGLTTEALDASRMASLRSSPMMEAIETMLDQADSELMSKLIPRLVKAMRKSVGLPSKLGISKVLVTMVVRNVYQISPYANELLAASRGQLTDRNDTVAQSYAISSGYLCRAASNEAVLEYVSFLKELFFASETDRNRLVSGTAVLAISSYASDKFSGLESEFLPFVYVAKHDNDESVSKNFERVWSDNTGGSGAVKLHLKEILILVSLHLKSRKWNIREVAAKSIADASGDFDEQNGANQDILAPLYDTLLQACSGKSWKGKEFVFESLVKLAIKTKKHVHGDLLRAIDKTAITEVSRRNKDYQVAVFEFYGLYAGAFTSEHIYDSLFSVADKYLGVEESTSSSESDEGEDKNMKGTLSNNSKKEQVRNKILKGVISGFSITDRDGNDITNQLLPKFVNYLNGVFSDERILPTWRTELVFIECTTQIIERLLSSKKSGDAMDSDLSTHVQSFLLNLWKTIMLHCAKDQNHEKVRIESARLARLLLQTFTGDNSQLLQSDIKELIASEVSPIVKKELEGIE